jgi:hypothetical protein
MTDSNALLGSLRNIERIEFGKMNSEPARATTSHAVEAITRGHRARAGPKKIVSADPLQEIE